MCAHLGGKPFHLTDALGRHLRAGGARKEQAEERSEGMPEHAA